jgi:hypothetical protein
MSIKSDNKLTSEQMDGVVGGSWDESYCMDLKNAYDRKLPGFEKMNPEDGSVMVYCMDNWDSVVGQLKTMFAGYGIDMTYRGKYTEKNIYSYKGQRISIDQAWQIIDGKKI